MRRPPAEDVRAGLVVALVLFALGAALGALWQWWSPPGPIGLVIAPGAIQPNDTEAFVAGDGRFALITAVVGLLAGTLAWQWRERRGPVLALALALGGVGGALLTEGVGHLIRGGSASAPPGMIVEHLPLSLHATGLLFVESAAALLVYGLCVAFAGSDDLGRPDATDDEDSGTGTDAAGQYPEPVPSVD
ncbi:MAG TPA: DUF2567 domain-containing protein [Jatrophihabitantaceae bacterium]